MNEKKNKISLLRYFKTNKKKYLKFSIEIAFKNLQEDYIADYPEIINSKNNVMAMVESLDEALNEINFNWIADLEKASGLKYKNKDRELINNLDSFIKTNKNFIKKIIRFNSYYKVLELWQNYIGERIKNTGSFTNDKFNSETNIIFIKLKNSKEYLENSNDFIIKIFGEKESNVSLNFLYKRDDDELAPDNLSAKITEHKIKNILLKK